MKELTIEQKAKRYDEAIERAKNTIEVNQTISDIVECVESLFPELKESEERKAIKYSLDHVFTNNTTVFGVTKEQCLAWLEKQGEQNPYSGVSFEYNGHIWGMCARDNGVDILLDKQLFKHLEKQSEQKPAWSEEDEQYFNFLEKLLVTLQVELTEGEIKKGTNSNSKYYYKVIQWLKSLRPQTSLEAS